MDMFPIYSSDILVPLTEWPLDIWAASLNPQAPSG